MGSIGREVDELQRENRLLRQKLNLAVEQRNGVIANYHALLKTPFKERTEIVIDLDDDLEKLENGTPTE